MSETRTIDKMSFKINIPILGTIILCTAFVVTSYMSLQTDIKVIALELKQHGVEQENLLASVVAIQQDQKSQDSRISDIDKRVYKLEKNQY